MAQTNLVGQTILGYTVTEKINSGAFGTVYKVEKVNPSGQYVRALKHITIPTEKQYMSVLNSMGGDVSKADNYFSEMLKDIVSEIQILNALSEKGVDHIVRYYENDITMTESPKRYDVYILMEYLTPLEDYIMENEFNLYQIFTYVKNKDYELRAKDHTVSGMLLYAKTDEEIYPNNVYQMSGNQITVRTLDLNLPFDEIAGQLNTIAKTHFDL